ncbi:hypothetical protein EGW08_013071 [Elysia chlorotica]|uniref:Uncharacterized protein n=1 Tax=Elysia chlorotica TaxID=188477 RepID=A0A433TC37_ELYCH|nr:hypothetical protein EGW08_013071 [Elysia chlorotica]
MMGFSVKFVAVLLLVALVGLSFTEAQRGRGGGRGRGRGRGPPEGGNQGNQEGEGQGEGQGQRGPGSRGQGQGQRGSGGQGQGQGQRGPGGQGQRGPGGRGPGERGPAGPGGRGGRPDRELPAGDLYIWNQTLSTGEVVVQRVFVPENKSVMIAGSRGDKDAGFMPGRTLYDFSGASGVVAIRPRGGFFPCFITDTTLNFDTLMGVTGLITLNETENTVAHGQENLDGTSEKLPLDATTALYEAQPELKRFCGFAGVVIAAPLGDLPPFEGETRNVTVLTYDSEVTLTVPVGIQGRGRGRGSRRG